mmetsp:Transcript_11126/g.23897  ORF Transcript_11126/g.23897 Transcript_11126/m.23897 type:complete len:142 (+) Transcript_11126:1550-1975(+)
MEHCNIEWDALTEKNTRMNVEVGSLIVEDDETMFSLMCAQRGLSNPDRSSTTASGPKSVSFFPTVTVARYVPVEINEEDLVDAIETVDDEDWETNPAPHSFSSERSRRNSLSVFKARAQNAAAEKGVQLRAKIRMMSLRFS